MFSGDTVPKLIPKLTMLITDKYGITRALFL